jgi:hypothetical protein
VHFDTDAEELVGGVHASMVAGPRCRTHSHACEFRRSTHTKLVCGPRPHVDRPSRALLRLDRQSSRIAIQVTPAHRIPERPVQRGVYSPDCGWRQRGPRHDHRSGAAGDRRCSAGGACQWLPHPDHLPAPAEKQQTIMSRINRAGVNHHPEQVSRINRTGSVKHQPSSHRIRWGGWDSNPRPDGL